MISLMKILEEVENNKVKSVNVNLSEFNTKMKKEIPIWKDEYNNDIAQINQRIAFNYLQYICEKYLKKPPQEISFNNERKKPQNHFQLEMWLSDTVRLWATFVHVKDDHTIDKQRSNIELDEDDGEEYVTKIKFI